MINTSQSELEVLAFPRSIFSVPTRDIVYDPSLLRAIPEPMWFKQDLVEQNPQFKQIVPFIMFFCDGKALTFTNGSSHSLGLHDHIVFEDGDYLSGFLRIYNALSIQSVGVPSSRYIGLINDDTTPFGKTHIGMIHTVHFPYVNPKDPKIASRIQEITSIKFCDAAELAINYENFDDWSKQCIDQLDILKVKQLGMPL